MTEKSKKTTVEMPFYAVARGHQTGIFLTWDECQKNTKGFPKPSFRKFNSREEAQDFISANSGLDNDSLILDYS